MGLAVCAVVVLSVVTGVLLNHTEGLSLDQRFVESEAVLGWYGIEAPEVARSHCPDARCVSQVGRRLYFDETRLDGEAARLLGAVRLPELYVVAADDRLIVLTPAGALVEQLGEAEGVPADVRRIGVSAEGAVVLETPAGRQVADAELLSWSPAPTAAPVRWSQPAAAPEGLSKALAARFRGGSITYERVILDLHSGRFFGRFGPLFIDASAIVLLLLSLTGFRMWWRQRRSSRSRRPSGQGAGTSTGS